MSSIALLLVSFVVLPAHAAGPDRVSPVDMPGGTAASAGLQQGTVSHSVPLELPPAPAGLVPDLALVADPHVPDGWLGPNWALAGFSRIERHSALGGVPTFDAIPGTSADQFTVDGTRLWDNTASATSGAPGGSFWSATVWEPEVQDGRVFDYDAGDNVWRARSHGWTWEYGAAERNDEPGFHVCAPTCGRGSSAWLLTTVTDPFGNQMEFEYAALPSGLSAPTFTGTTAPVLDDDYAYSHVPVAIHYGGGLNNSVTFTWDERTDVLMDARSGRLRVLPARLAEITTFVGSDEYSRYSLQYQGEAGATACAGESYVPNETTSVLKRIFRTGTSGGTRELRCIETDESDSSWAENPGYSIGSLTAITGTHSRAQVVNFDGDPWPDLLAIGNNLELEDGEDYFLTDSLSTVDAGFMRGSRYGLEEDAAAELSMVTTVVTTDLLGGSGDTYEHEGDPGWAEPGGYAFVDLDRNGTTDIVAGGDDLVTGEVYTLLADGTTATETLDLSVHPGRMLRFAQWADIDGDGFVDLVLPANDKLDDDAVIAALPGYTLGASHWIRNEGAPPYLSADSLQTLVVPFEDSLGLTSLPTPLDELYASDCSEGDFEPPDDYYGERWQWQQTWAQWGDYNADGVADVAYGVHACWTASGLVPIVTATGENAWNPSSEEAYEASAL